MLLKERNSLSSMALAAVLNPVTFVKSDCVASVEKLSPQNLVDLKSFFDLLGMR